MSEVTTLWVRGYPTWTREHLKAGRTDLVFLKHWMKHWIQITSLLEWLLIDYSKKTKLEFSVYPALSVSTCIIEPYNSILTTHFTTEHSNCSCMVLRPSMTCHHMLGVECSSYASINRLICLFYYCFLLFWRALECVLNWIREKLVPYLRIYFPITIFALFHLCWQNLPCLHIKHPYCFLWVLQQAG